MTQKKRVLITGGAQGIGFAAAELFLERGYEVAIWALHADSVQRAVAALGERVFGQTVDVGSEEQVKAAYQQLVDEFGIVNILVNNAGYTLTSRFLDEDSKYWRRVVDTNLWGVIYTTRAVLGDMVAAESGSIVNVVSDAGRVGMAGEAVYAASKGGVVAFSKSIAQEAARYHVRVNCVSPGPTRTRILEINSEHEDAQKLIDKMIRRIPLRKIAEPRDVAEAIVFLASDAASQITGQVLSVSGGLTMV
ncbi:SDR family NAD(P)-dependent oxidoreductase [Alicyclobacillus kakegawensis]|uniref:SDR family NAD(P)-dependent oxidoreductase n=1 Tax=Alicyclobacillus kakegawensis TaxID=392012 RepID=UPI00083155E0|nr:SDR family NAD(P)-dependent oxidoreductase [Alicyclobacillus kakegawensis]